MPHHIPCVTCAPFSYQFRALFWKKGEKICFVPLLLFLICMYVNVQLYWILFLVKKKKKQNIQKKKKKQKQKKKKIPLLKAPKLPFA